MTKEELLKKLEDFGKNNDKEMAHVYADDALLDYINDKDISAALQSWAWRWRSEEVQKETSSY